MKKLLIFGCIGAVALVAVAKTTNLCSYAGTLISQVRAEAQNQVPTKFELARIKNEIAGLDRDISQMVRPIAEYKTVIERLRKDIARNEANISERKKTMLAVLEDLKSGQKSYEYGGKTFTVDRIQRQLQRDTEELKHLEKATRTHQQVLDAKELALKATQEQLAKVIQKKREYEVRLAELEAAEESLQIARIGSDIKIDNSRATQIEDALTNIENRQQTERNVLSLQNGDITGVPLHDRTKSTPDLQSIRAYLEGNTQNDQRASTNK